MDILDEREYFFPRTYKLEIPYLKLARYFDYYLGNLFMPFAPCHEKKIRESGSYFIYDLEEFLFFLREKKEYVNLYRFSILYDRKKVDYFRLFCRSNYKNLYY